MRHQLTGIAGPLALAMATTLAASTAEPDDAWKFRVFLDDRDIGHHHFEAYEDGPATRIHIEARFEVSWWILTAYRYRHDNVETWHGDCLRTLDSSTDDDGKAHRVDIRPGDGIATVEPDPGKDYTFDGCPRTFAYWNPDALESGPMINAQTGELVNVTVSPPVPETLEVHGETVAAERRELTWPDGEITLWHAVSDGRWVGLQASAPGGRTLRYVPVSSG